VTVFKLAILTPYRLLYSASAESVRFVTNDGWIEILAGHEPFVAPVAIGAVRIRGPEGERVAAVSEGVATIRPDRVELLLDAAEWPEEIDAPRAAAALERARKRLETETMPWEIERSRAAAARASNRVAIAALAPAAEGAGR